jgi:mRNA interferase YafQ
MLTPAYTAQFRKDVERAKRRGKNLEKWKIVARSLLAGEPLDPIHRDRRLLGSFAGRRKCHIESDWLLTYKVEPPLLVFERMGTYVDLFQE